MYRFVVRRLLLAALTMFIVSVATFFMLRLIPGDIIDLMLADFGYAADRTLLEAQMGLDRPVYVQFSSWFLGLLSGDLGDSLWTSRTVAFELSVRYPVTIELAVIAIVTSMVVSIPIGIVTAVRQDTISANVGVHPHALETSRSTAKG